MAHGASTGEIEVPETDRRSPDTRGQRPAPERAAGPTSGVGGSPDQRATGAGAAGDDTDTNAFAIAAMVLGVLAVFFLPIILGPIGIALAVMARNRHQSLANIALWVAIGGTVAGLALGIMAATIA
jgi:hypothetical protein